MRCRLLLTITITVAAFAGPAEAVELRVLAVDWGFGGNLMTGAFNPVTIEIQNQDSEVFSGMLDFVAEDAYAGAVPHRRGPFRMAPGERRRVQFFVRPTLDVERWRLTGVRRPIESPPQDMRDRRLPIRLWAEDSEHTSTAVFPFPERRFPPSVSALEGISALVLDHDPDWSTARRQALRDWVHLGGELHVLPDVGLGYPDLTGELSVFRPSAPGVTSFGAGRVYAHDFDRRQLDRARANQLGLVPGPQSSPSRANLNETIWNSLAETTRPDLGGGSIWVGGVALFLLLGPINWFLSRKVRHYLWSLLFTVVVLATFTMGFFALARGAFSARSGVYGITHARVLEDGFALAQWNHVFVTRGQQVRFHQPSPFGLYEAGPTDLLTAGAIEDGDSVSLDLPIFSNRQYFFAGRVPGKGLIEEIDIAAVTDGVLQLRFRIDPDLKAPLFATVFLDGRSVPMTTDADGWVSDPQPESPRGRFLEPGFEDWQVEALCKRLAAARTDARKDASIPAIRTPPGLLRVFVAVHADTPPGPLPEGLPPRTQYVLYEDTIRISP